MCSDAFPVDESFALIINRSEMDQNAFPLPFFGDLQSPVIEHRRNEVFPSDARKFAFRTERHDDFPTESF